MNDKVKKTLSIVGTTLILSNFVSCKKDDNSIKTIENSTSNITEENTTKLEPTTIIETSKLETTTEFKTTTQPETTIKNDTTTELESTTINEIKYKNNDSLIICSDSNYVIPNELEESIMEEIKDFSEEDISFLLCDINTGTTFSYNLDETYNGACIVKPSVVLYLLKLAEKGNINLNDTIKYPGNNVSGSGYLNGYYSGYQARTGQEISIFEYMYHCLYYSDNNAYKVLYDLLLDSEYYDDYVKYMNEIDASSLCVNDERIWVRKATATAGVNVIKEVEKFYEESKRFYNVDYDFADNNNLKDATGNEYLTYGELLHEIMARGKYDYLEENTGNYSISKTGFVSGNGPLSCRNIISYSYPENGNPYAICLLTKFNSESSRKHAVKLLLCTLNDTVIDYQKSNNKVLIKY